MDHKRLAYGLGWFSIGLGITEIVAATPLASFFGIPRQTPLLRLFGFREVGAGIGILRSTDPGPWMWGRVGGDALDLAALGAAMGKDNPQRGRVAAAIGVIAAITALDAYNAYALSAADGKSQAETADSPPITQTITIGKSADELYGLLHDAQTLAQVMEPVAKITPVNDQRAHWVAELPLGRSLTWDMELIDDRPGESMRWRSLTDTQVPATGSVAFRAAPGDRGTEVTLRLELEPPGGAVGAAGVKLLRAVPQTMLYKALRRFKSLAETGEIPTTERQPAARNDGRDT